MNGDLEPLINDLVALRQRARLHFHANTAPGNIIHALAHPTRKENRDTVAMGFVSCVTSLIGTTRFSVPRPAVLSLAVSIVSTFVYSVVGSRKCCNRWFDVLDGTTRALSSIRDTLAEGSPVDVNDIRNRVREIDRLCDQTEHQIMSMIDQETLEDTRLDMEKNHMICQSADEVQYWFDPYDIRIHPQHYGTCAADRYCIYTR